MFGSSRYFLRGIRLHKCPFWLRPAVVVADHKGGPPLPPINSTPRSAARPPEKHEPLLHFRLPAAPCCSPCDTLARNPWAATRVECADPHLCRCAGRLPRAMRPTLWAQSCRLRAVAQTWVPGLTRSADVFPEPAMGIVFHAMRDQASRSATWSPL